MPRSIVLLFCALVLLASNSAVAGGKAEKVARLMALDGTEAVVAQVITRQLPLVRQSFRKRYPSAEAGAEAVYVEAFAEKMRARRGELIGEIATAYGAAFEDGELDSLLAFFESPVGQKYRAAAPALLETARRQGRVWGEANAAELSKAARDAVAARGLKLK